VVVARRGAGTGARVGAVASAARSRPWPRRRVLGLGVAAGLLGAGCGPPEAVPPPSPRPLYWEPALTVAARALDVLRALEVNTRAFAQQTLTAERFVRAIETLSPEISSLAQIIVPLQPPAAAVDVHAHLSAAVDTLVEVLPTVRAYQVTEQRERLAHITTLSGRVRGELDAFIAGIGPGQASEGLRRIMDDLGAFALDVLRVQRLALLVGQFDDEAQARARLSGLADSIRLSPVFRRWVEVARLDDAPSADRLAAEWRARGFETRTEEVADLVFNLTNIKPPVARSWKELAWLGRVEFDASHLASSGRAERVVAVSRDGKVAAFDAFGARLWQQDLRIPIARASVHHAGRLIAAYGFDLAMLDPKGAPIWPATFRPDNQLLEQVLFDQNAERMIVRSTNASEVGHVFAYTRTGQYWGPTRDYIGAAWVDLHPTSGQVAVGSAKLGESQVVLVQPDGNLDQRFGVEGRILRVRFTVGGEATIALTSEGMQVFHNVEGDPLHRLRFPATAVARTPGADTVILAGDAGIGKFALDGRELWFVPGLQARDILPTADYVAALIDDHTVIVIRPDGTLLGDAVSLAELRGVAVAEDRNLLLAVSADRNVQAWQLPALHQPPAG